MPARRVWARGALAAAFVVATAAGLLLHGCAWSRLPYHDVPDAVRLPVDPLSDLEFGAVFETFPRPFVVEVRESGGGSVLVYGAEHTRDPDDPQIRDIRRRWRAFAPTVALCESRLGVLFPGLMDPVETFCEPGAVHALARADRVPTYTWEPREEGVVGSLLRTFPAEHVALSLVLRPYFSNLRHGRPDDPESFVADFLDRAEQPGLEGTITSVADIDALWRRDFPGEPDWRETSDEYGLPGYLADVAARANAARTRHLARAAVHLARRGERVFAVAGSSHAVKIEPALRAALEAP